MTNSNTPIPEAVQQALAEVLNLAAEVAEMQLDDESREGIYELLDSVANYFEIDSHRLEIELDDDDDDADDAEAGCPPREIPTRIIDASTGPQPRRGYTIEIMGEDTPLPDRDFAPEPRRAPPKSKR